MTASNELRRSRDKVIAGVCGGIAERFAWPANRVRLVYLVLWFLMPGPERTSE